MKKRYYLLLLCSSFAFSQAWKTISLDENVQFDFPEVYTKIDTANLRVFSAQTSGGTFYVTKTIEKNTGVVSWDKWGIINLYTAFRENALEASGGELIGDEVKEFQGIKSAKFVIRKSEDNKYITSYYLVFYHKGLLYSFEFIETAAQPSNDGWDTKFYNEINIGKKSPALTKSPPSFKLPTILTEFSYLLLIPVILIPLIILIVLLVLWRRRKV